MPVMDAGGAGEPFADPMAGAHAPPAMLCFSSSSIRLLKAATPLTLPSLSIASPVAADRLTIVDLRLLIVDVKETAEHRAFGNCG